MSGNNSHESNGLEQLAKTGIEKNNELIKSAEVLYQKTHEHESSSHQTSASQSSSSKPSSGAETQGHQQPDAKHKTKKQSRNQRFVEQVKREHDWHSKEVLDYDPEMPSRLWIMGTGRKHMVEFEHALNQPYYSNDIIKLENLKKHYFWVCARSVFYCGLAYSAGVYTTYRFFKHGGLPYATSWQKKYTLGIVLASFLFGGFEWTLRVRPGWQRFLRVQKRIRETFIV